MAIGDDAAAAGMDLVLGSDAANTLDTEVNKTRDYIAQKTSDVTPVAKGGTGATNASGARSNLGAAAVGHKHSAADITSGTFGQNRLAANSVGSAQIQNEAVGYAQIAPDSVTVSKIKDGDVITAKLANDAVTAAKIANNAVGASQIANGAVGYFQLADGSVTGGKIEDATIATVKLIDGAVTSAKIANGAVGYAEIGDSAVTVGKIKDGDVITAKLADNAVTRAKIANDAVGSGQIAANAVGSSEIAANAVGNAQIASGAVAYAQLHPDLSERLEDGHYNIDVKTDGSFWTDGATAVTSAYVSAWINGDGRLGKSASSLRFKKYVSAMDPAAMGDIWPDLQRFQMRGGDGSWRYGYIAEYMAAVPDQERFVVYESEKNDDGDIVPKLDADGHPIPESIDFFGMLIAQVAQLQQRVTELEGRS